jgi:hypothetical protein
MYGTLNLNRFEKNIGIRGEKLKELRDSGGNLAMVAC